MFGIDGEQFPARFVGGGHDQFAGSDEDFLVGEGDGASQFYRFVGGFEADDPDSGGEDNFGVAVSGDGKHSLAAMVDGRKRREIFFA